MNLMADSGAILSTLMPFPLHSEETPPSCTIPRSPDHRLTARDEEPCTWKRGPLLRYSRTALDCLRWNNLTPTPKVVQVVRKVLLITASSFSLLSYIMAAWHFQLQTHAHSPVHSVLGRPRSQQPTVCFSFLWLRLSCWTLQEKTSFYAGMKDSVTIRWGVCWITASGLWHCVDSGHNPPPFPLLPSQHQ